MGKEVSDMKNLKENNVKYSSINNQQNENILAVFLLGQRLMKGKRGQLYFLLVTIALFNAEAALLMPVILKCGFQAIVGNDMQTLLKTAIGGVCAFGFNFGVMYFINVYGDAWVTKFAFHAVENSFKELSGFAVASVHDLHNDDDLFNRIAAGTGNIMGFYFCLADMIGNGVAVIALMAILYCFSNMFVVLIIMLVSIELIFVRLQFCYNRSYTKKLQKDKAESIRKVRSLLGQLSFHEHNQTGDWIQVLYGGARQQWFLTQEKKILTDALLDSCLIGIHGIFKMGLVYSFMVRSSMFRFYVDNAVSSFSTFSNLITKAKGFGMNISRMPDSLVPIQKLGDVLTQRPQHVISKEENYLMIKHISVSVGDKQIIKDASCRIPVGSKVAVIGENGSGKSTFLKTLAGLYQCQDKKVLDFGLKVAYIPADELLFQGHTVLDNISYSKSNLAFDAIKKQLYKLQFYDAESMCGKIPAQLSSGEAKRINIARGLFCDAQIILVDEPTSCLDKENACYVMEELFRLEGRTVIYITHDPVYINMADEIILVHNGQIRLIDKKEKM